MLLRSQMNRLLILRMWALTMKKQRICRESLDRPDSPDPMKRTTLRKDAYVDAPSQV